MEEDVLTSSSVTTTVGRLVLMSSFDRRTGESVVFPVDCDVFVLFVVVLDGIRTTSAFRYK